MSYEPIGNAFPIEPGQTYSFSGVSGGQVDVVYLTPDGRQRWLTNVPMPYTTQAEEGETHVQFVVRLPDFYMDSDE